MINNIQNALDSLGLSAQKRAIHIRFTNSALNLQLYLQRVDGEHQINQGMSAELICLSTDATIPLKQFIGCQVAVDTVTDRGALFHSTGIITQAEQGQSDGALTLYKLKLEDATELLVINPVRTVNRKLKQTYKINGYEHSESYSHPDVQLNTIYCVSKLIDQ